MKLTPSLEDYLKTIYILLMSKREVRVSDIASFMNVRLPSVTEAIKRLRDKGLVSYTRYSSVNLTSKGYEIAKNLLRRHQLLVYFLHNILGLPPELANREACLIEHFISDETLNRLSAFIEVFMRYCINKYLSILNGSKKSSNNNGCDECKSSDDVVVLWKQQ